MALFRQSAVVATSFWKCFQSQRRWESGLTAQLDIRGRSQNCSAKKPVVYSGNISMCPSKSSSVLDRIMMFKLPLTGVCLKWLERHQRRVCSRFCVALPLDLGRVPEYSANLTPFFCNLKQVFLFLPCTGSSKTSSTSYLELDTLEDCFDTSWGRWNQTLPQFTVNEKLKNPF